AQGGSITLSPQQTLDLFNEAVKDLKADRVNAMMREHMAEPPLVFYATSVPLEGGEGALRAAYDEAMKAPVAPFEVAAPTVWPYTNFGTPGVVASRRTLDAAGATLVRFANGTRLTVKPTDFAKDQVSIVVRFGHGQLDLPKNMVAASDFG